MALVPIKTASTTGYCDCLHGCYELASLRDEDTGKAFRPRCAKEHLEMNVGIGLPHGALQGVRNLRRAFRDATLPPSADPPAACGNSVPQNSSRLSA